MVMRQAAFPKCIPVLFVRPVFAVQPVRGIEMFAADNGNFFIHMASLGLQMYARCHLNAAVCRRRRLPAYFCGCNCFFVPQPLSRSGPCWTISGSRLRPVYTP